MSLAAQNRACHAIYRLMGRSSWPIAIRTRLEVRLEDRYQNQLQRPLHRGRELRARSASTAHLANTHLGWAEIRHPFHPLKGQRFLALKERRVASVDTLILRNAERGSFAVPKEWTVRSAPSPYEAPGMTPGRLDAQFLLDLVVLVEQLSVASEKEHPRRSLRNE